MIHFILNQKEIHTSIHPGTRVLDFLRLSEGLKGTKEGCREGECGSCMVLIGERHREKVHYTPVTSCMMPVGELHGKHLVTIEGLNGRSLSTVQQAVVDEGATQCGFCTPGIVVSLTGLALSKDNVVSLDGVKKALGGHLCRCTGYASLKNTARHLTALTGDNRDVKCLVGKNILPSYFIGIPEKLKHIPAAAASFKQRKSAEIIAGGTDIYVRKDESLADSDVCLLNLFPEMKRIRRVNGSLHVGALTTFQEFADNDEIKKSIPAINDYMFRCASWQIRNRATLGGNIVNASPAGDMTVLLLALGSDLVLADSRRKRIVPMQSFYKGYKTLDKKQSEILTEIHIPVLPSGTRIHFEKVSKRKCLDVAAVNSAIRIICHAGVVQDVGLAMGGVAPMPLFMKETCRYLAGLPLTTRAVKQSLKIAQAEISPISDIRGSEDYKRLLVRQLMIAHFTKLFDHQLNLKDFL